MNSGSVDNRRVAHLTVALVVVLLGLYAASIVYIVARSKAVDFSLYYLAAYGFARGEDVYALGGKRDPTSQAVWDRLARETGVENYAPPYRYPPLTAALVWPLTFLPPYVGMVLWLAASAFALIGSGWLLGKTSTSTFGVPVALVLLAGFVPAALTLYAGQVNGFVLLTVCWALHAATRGKLRTAGAAAGIGAMLKLVPLAHLAYLGWRRQWGAVVVGLAMIGACLVGALPLVGWHGLVSYAHNFETLSAWGQVSAAPGNQALSGFIARTLVAHDNPNALADAPHLAWWLARLSSAALVIATAALCWPQGARTDTLRLELALVTTAVTLVPPYVWYHQFVLLLLPFFVLIDHGLTHPSERWMLFPLALGYVLTGIFGIAWRSIENLALAGMPLYTALLVWLLLARLIVNACPPKSVADCGRPAPLTRGAKCVARSD